MRDAIRAFGPAERLDYIRHAGQGRVQQMTSARAAQQKPKTVADEPQLIYRTPRARNAAAEAAVVELERMGA